MALYPSKSSFKDPQDSQDAAQKATTILYHTILYYTILYYTILYYTILYYTILYYTILYYTILYYTILYYTILYYTILYYTMLLVIIITTKELLRSTEAMAANPGHSQLLEEGAWLGARLLRVGHMSHWQKFVVIVMTRNIV